MWFVIILTIFILVVIVGYLTKFRSKGIFQGLYDEAWFPVQYHKELYIHYCHAQFFDNKSSKVILYCHGNYGNMSYYPHMPLLAKRLGISLLMFDYRGFGLSKGLPSTDTIKQDGCDVYDWLKQYYDEIDIIIWGESLGGSIAAWIASKNNPSKVVLVSTFSDIHDVIKMHGEGSYFIDAVVAVADILYDSLPIKKWIRDISAPICIVHSLYDTYIPFTCATINAKASSNVVEFISIAGDHTTPEMSSDNFERLGKFLDIDDTLCYTAVVTDFASVRENSPLCQL